MVVMNNKTAVAIKVNGKILCVIVRSTKSLKITTNRQVIAVAIIRQRLVLLKGLLISCQIWRRNTITTAERVARCRTMLKSSILSGILKKC